ncbi:MAG: hypothetical protein ACKVHE_00890 [Planctomycetales bacterium]|jgi:hypothetical protein
MLNARPKTRSSLQCLILSACVAVGLSLEARGQEFLEFADDASFSGVTSGSPLDRLPNILGDFFQATGQSNVTFRPEGAFPANAAGPVVLDAASNRFVYIDGSDNLLVPGNVGLGTEFVFFRAVGGGLLTETTNAAGLTGFFGLERVSIDSTSGAQTVTSSVDILTGTGATSVTDPVSGATFNATPNNATLSVITGTTTSPAFGNVGQLKMASGGSPIPRDRFFFNYNYFESVPLANSASVNQFVPGFEKTFMSGLMSVEARFPFAATLDNDVNINGSTGTSTGQIGDISVALKSIFSKNDNWLVSGGLQIVLPTAEDLSYSVTDGSSTREFLRIENEAVHLMPFFGASYIADGGLFLQGFFQIDVDANGMLVSTNSSPFGTGTMSQVGTLNAATMMYLDVSAGYWLVQEPADSTSTLTAIMPLWELHLSRSLTDSESVNFSPLGSIGREDNFQLLNTTFGMVFEFQHNTTISAGYATAIPGGKDDDFAGEFRLHVSHRFGTN